MLLQKSLHSYIINVANDEAIKSSAVARPNLLTLDVMVAVSHLLNIACYLLPWVLTSGLKLPWPLKLNDDDVPKRPPCGVVGRERQWIVGNQVWFTPILESEQRFVPPQRQIRRYIVGKGEPFVDQPEIVLGEGTGGVEIFAHWKNELMDSR